MIFFDQINANLFIHLYSCYRPKQNNEKKKIKLTSALGEHTHDSIVLSIQNCIYLLQFSGLMVEVFVMEKCFREILSTLIICDENLLLKKLEYSSNFYANEIV